MTRDVAAIRDEDVARAFHEAYERLAPSFGYETRKASAVPWEDVPATNKALMVAVAGEVRAVLLTATPLAEPAGPATNEHGRVDCVACGYSLLPGTWANHVLGAGHQRKAALFPTQASDSPEKP